MTIHPCTLDDLEVYTDTLRSAYIDTYLYLWSDDGQKYIKRSFHPKQILQEYHNPDTLLFLLKDDSHPVGVLKVNVGKDQHGGGNSSLEIERLYILSIHKGKNYGRQAIYFVKDLAKLKQYTYIWLKVMDSSGAITFYIKNGFTKIGIERLSYPELWEDKKGMYIMIHEIV